MKQRAPAVPAVICQTKSLGAGADGLTDSATESGEEGEEGEEGVAVILITRSERLCGGAAR